MASRGMNILKSFLSGGVVIAILGWLALLTVHVIKNEKISLNDGPLTWLRQKRSSSGLQAPGGATYIRWGKKDCPNGADLIYKGIAGGSHYTHYGGGGEYICLSDNPKYVNTVAGRQGNAVIYGVELEVSTVNLFSGTNAKALHDSDVQCAVCRSQARTSMVMIPATNECPGSDWNREYWGYLMTEHYGHKASRGYACVDNEPDTGSKGGFRNDNGALMYHVEGRCGSLPCNPPYTDGLELTCVVCTK